MTDVIVIYGVILSPSADGRRIPAVTLFRDSAEGDELHGCLAEFTLSELRRFFSRDCGIRMTGEGFRMTAGGPSMIASP